MLISIISLHDAGSDIGTHVYHEKASGAGNDRYNI